MDIFGGDAVSYNRLRVVVADIEMESIFRTRTNEIFDEVEASTRPEPAPVRIGIFGLDHDVGVKKNVAVKRKVPIGRKPSWRIH